MCSTPRSSAPSTITRRLSVHSSSHIQSDLQLMRIASDIYERKLEERAKSYDRQAKEKKQK